MKYETEKTCCSEISFEIEDNKIKSVDFTKGCAGNLGGISSLVIGMDVDDVIKKLSGIDCKGRGTSCPDQLSLALKKYKASKE